MAFAEFLTLKGAVTPAETELVGQGNRSTDKIDKFEAPNDRIAPISEKRLEANRRNAQLSTGPKSEHGKQRCRRNAWKHGILASKALISHGKGAEDKKAFQKLLQDLYRNLRPIGPMEEFLVEEIATCMWRSRRWLESEVAIIGRQCAPSIPDLDLNPDRTSISDHLKLPGAPI